MDTTKADAALHNTPDAAKKVTETVAVCARCGGRHTDALFRPLANPQVVKAAIVVTHWAPCPTTGQPISRFLAASDEMVRDSDALAVAAATDREKDDLAAALQRARLELADKSLACDRLVKENADLVKAVEAIKLPAGTTLNGLQLPGGSTLLSLPDGATYRHDDKANADEYQRLAAALHAGPADNPADVFRAAACQIEHLAKLDEQHAAEYTAVEADRADGKDAIGRLEAQVAAAVKDRDDWKLLAELNAPAAAHEDDKPKKRK